MTEIVTASECPQCGGPISYAEREADEAVVGLCRGQCGNWTILEEHSAENHQDPEGPVDE